MRRIGRSGCEGAFLFLVFRVYLGGSFSGVAASKPFSLPDVKANRKVFYGCCRRRSCGLYLDLTIGFFPFFFLASKCRLPYCFSLSVFLLFSLFSGSCWLEGAQQEGGVSFVGCGLGGLDLAASALVVSAMRPRPWWSQPWWSRPRWSRPARSQPRWSRPVRSRPWWSRPCGLGLRGGLDLCGLDLRGFVSTSAVSTSASVSYSALLALLSCLFSSSRQSTSFVSNTNLGVMSLPEALSFLLGSWEPSLITVYGMCESVWVCWQTKVSFVARDGVGYGIEPNDRDCVHMDSNRRNQGI
jgi:hypothetical protein